jgi:hypothetical protein
LGNAIARIQVTLSKERNARLVLRRRRLAIVVGTIRWNKPTEPLFNPIERALDSFIHLRNHLLESLVIAIN